MEIVAIDADDELYRRLAPDTIDDEARIVRRNACYTTGRPDPEVSVHVRRLAGSIEAILAQAGRPHFGVGLIRVSELRALGFEAEHRPLIEDSSHAVVRGLQTRAHCDQLAEITRIVKWPMVSGSTDAEERGRRGT